MNRDEGQYQFTHSFDECLVQTARIKVTDCISNWQPTCCYEKQRRQTSMLVTHPVLILIVAFVETYTVSGSELRTFEIIDWTSFVNQKKLHIRT